ncbi:MAG: bacillithiol biosynthesis cysteine-adding enzyme BshC [Bryobacterales bacterium]|nr:bacillithiol biosynthesis cysteine-adding enzyme BshC [Bryobacterales bacterium]
MVCKRHTEIPHTSRLFADLLYHFDRVSEFYPNAPFDPHAFRNAAAAIDYPDERRARLVALLREQNGESETLQLLAKSGTNVVVTGQQVGLFSGPAYTLYKALTAVRLARTLTEAGSPTVPIFWLATEDHDLDEVSTCWSFTPTHEPVHLRVDHPRGSDLPVGGIPIEAPPVEALAQSLRGFPFGDEVTELVREAYIPGRSYGEAFAHLLRKLTAPYGLLFFDPMNSGARALAGEFLVKAVDAAPDLTRLLLERNRRLNDGGYHAQVHIEAHTSLFFLIDNGHRLALRQRNGEYAAKDRRFSPQELKDRAASLSPNAALRPVVQDYMMPTVAYIGGPAELAYLAQSAVIYKELLGRMPVSVPRNAFSLIDERSRKLLDRYSLDLDAFFGGEEPLRERMAATLTPPDVQAHFRQVSAATQVHLESLIARLQAFDGSLSAAMRKSAAKIEYQLGKMQKKAAREALRRDTRAQADAAYLFNGIYPHKHLQERFYTILPFLARHGLDLTERLYDSVHTDCPDHHILFL